MGCTKLLELTDHRFTAWHDKDNMRWIHESIQGYKPFFNGFELDQSRYVNSGFIIFNEKHKEFFQSFKKLYYDNVDTFVELQDKIVNKGTEQTPMNYWLQKSLGHYTMSKMDKKQPSKGSQIFT